MINNGVVRSEEHTSELQSQFHLVCRLLLETKNSKWMIAGNLILALGMNVLLFVAVPLFLTCVLLSKSCFFFMMILRAPRSTLFPYTTLFRSNETRRMLTRIKFLNHLDCLIRRHAPVSAAMDDQQRGC